MYGKLIVSLMLGWIAMANAECIDGWELIGGYCFSSGGKQSSYQLANEACRSLSLENKVSSFLLDVQLLNDYELVGLENWIQANWPTDYYLWNSGVQNKFDPAVASQTTFASEYSCPLACNDPRFCTASCNNTEEATHSYLKLKHGIACLVNSPDNFNDLTICQSPSPMMKWVPATGPSHGCQGKK